MTKQEKTDLMAAGIVIPTAPEVALPAVPKKSSLLDQAVKAGKKASRKRGGVPKKSSLLDRAVKAGNKASRKRGRRGGLI